MISVGVDVGGTFIDVVAADWEERRYTTTKAPTTPSHLAEGVVNATLTALDLARARPGDVSRFVHGTTIGTNAVLEQSSSPVGILATAGFEDVLEIGRLRRTQLYDLEMDAETPIFLAPRRYRKGIRERIDAAGQVVLELDEAHAESVVRDLVDEGVKSFAVCFLHAYRNPIHERRVRAVIGRVGAQLSVSLSSEVDPMFREYERTVVTAFDAYLRPVIQNYLGELAVKLRHAGITAPLQIMQSRGGIASAGFVASRPVTVLLSGPAAGTIGGSFAAERSGVKDVITIDIGGTSADVALVEGGRPLIASEGKIDVHSLRIPMIDITTIGAGGGSVAWIDSGGRARVGPNSAGADPGPAAYGRGGTKPTVTDASLILGYLNPDYFAAGKVSLDTNAARRAVGEFAQRLGVTTVQAAEGIHRIVNANMADAIRLVSVKRGFDPRRFSLVVLGGAGGIHGGRLATEVGMSTILVPALPGVLSAVGLLVASVEHGRNRPFAARADQAEPQDLELVYQELEAELATVMEGEGVLSGTASTSRSVEMRYVSQSYEIDVPVGQRIDLEELAAAATRFNDQHERQYGHKNPGASVEIVNLKVVQSWPLPRPTFGATSRADREESLVPTLREAYFAELGGYVKTPVYARHQITAHQELQGPTIIEQADTTVIIYPGHRGVVDEAGNILISAP